MEIVLLIVSILLIIIVLLQSGKAESAGQIVQGGNSDLFANTKERGFELFLTRLSMLLDSFLYDFFSIIPKKLINKYKKYLVSASLSDIFFIK